MPGLAGTTLGRYSIVDRLGRGGMSEVYLAYDERMQRNVAIKVVSGIHADYLERFHREADAIVHEANAVQPWQDIDAKSLPFQAAVYREKKQTAATAVVGQLFSAGNPARVGVEKMN